MTEVGKRRYNFTTSRPEQFRKVTARLSPFLMPSTANPVFRSLWVIADLPPDDFLFPEGRAGFDYADVEFVSQIMEQVTGVLENIRLVDSLASDAAGQERRKIAQDIHDSIIQPYIGLKFGLAAVKQKLETGEDVKANVEELLALTDGEINDLRSYVGGLRRGESPQEIFLPAVKRFASKFSEATGLRS